MLKVIDLKKNFDKNEGLNGVNISVGNGKIYGLVGSNGSGKTTLLKHIMQIYIQDSGIIEFDGEQVFENSHFFENFYYIQDNLFFPDKCSLIDVFNYEKIIYKNISEEKFNKLVNFFQIDTKKSLNKMSKGQKKQAAFVLGISTCPKLLLLDEIVDGLDAVIKKKLWKVLINEIMESNLSVIISSHDLKELDNICDKVGIMHNGKIIREEDLETLKEGIKKIQFAIDGDIENLMDLYSDDFNILSKKKIGSLYVCIVSGNVDKLKNILGKNYNILIFDELSIDLEEIFITELRGVGYGKENE